MLSPALSAKFHREAEDAVAAIIELTHAADAVAADPYDRAERLEALETLFHAVRHLTSVIVAVSRITAREGERDCSPAGASFYRCQLRLELARLDDPKEV